MMSIIELLKNIQSPLNIAHRGGMALYPENTLFGFHASVDKHHADMLEMDLRITKDRRVVVFHDDTLDRTTNGKGEVCDHTYHELSQLDAGYCLSINNTFKYREQGIKIPLLEDVLEQFPDTYVNIEIKDNDEEMVGEVLEIINNYNASERIIIGSAQFAQNSRIYNMIPDCGHYLSELDMYLFATLGYCGLRQKYWQKFDVVEVPLKYHGVQVYPLLKSAAETIGLPIFVWGANDLDLIKKLQADKVDGIMTDRPDLV